MGSNPSFAIHVHLCPLLQAGVIIGSTHQGSVTVPIGSHVESVISSGVGIVAIVISIRKQLSFRPHIRSGWEVTEITTFAYIISSLYLGFLVNPWGQGLRPGPGQPDTAVAGVGRGVGGGAGSQCRSH